MTELLPEVVRVFYLYCGGGKEMDGRSFVKLCRDSDLIDSKFSATDADLVFAKAVLKGQRRIGLEEFQLALIFLAERRRSEKADVFKLVAENGGPALTMAKTEAARFFEERSAEVAPSINAAPRPISASLKPPSTPRGKLPELLPSPPQKTKSLLPPSPAARHRSTSRTSGTSDGSASVNSSPSPSLSPSPSRACQEVDCPDMLRELEMSFQAYCGPAWRSGMDGKTFVKLCKDAGLVDTEMSSTVADLIFAKAAVKGQRRIDVQQLKHALLLVAERKGLSAGLVLEMVCRHGFGGPQLNGTRADAVRFYDDKSTYTGVHANGGPESTPIGRGTATQLAANGMRFSY